MMMDWKSNLRRTQSVKSIPSSCDPPTEPRQWDKLVSVSQLVTRYQSAERGNTLIQKDSVDNAARKTKQLTNVVPASPREISQTRPESLTKTTKEKDLKRVETNLIRCKSESSLQNSVVSIDALKALFESKATAQNKAQRNISAANVSSTPSAKELVTKDLKKEKLDAENNKKKEAKVNNSAKKMVTETSVEKRKTIGGIDLPQVGESQAQEKRRSVADFRESSLIQTISVKAISALYLSKVAGQEAARKVNKPVGKDPSCDSENRAKLTKMNEDSPQKMENSHQLPSESHQPRQKDISSTSQLSKEKLYQQRQKCELRRLLKHTHPELKMDDVVDEEFAEVLNAERVTAGETGYEGEVLSRCLIFENSGLSNNVSAYTPTIHIGRKAEEEKDTGKKTAVSEISKAAQLTEINKKIIDHDKGVNMKSNLDTEDEDETIKIDVQATRMIFENQSRQNQEKIKVFLSGAETKPQWKPNPNPKSSSGTKVQPQTACLVNVGQNTDHNFAACKETLGSKVLFQEASENFSDSENQSDIPKPSVAILKNNPFISANIEREQSFGQTVKSSNDACEAYVAANVKNRTHLFESMPFDKIRHQNEDEIEMLVEDIRETLNFFYRKRVIHSSGAIIEVNEPMTAKKAKFILSETGPEINYNEVAEGGAQNFLLQLLPRGNLKPQITYLKEDSNGCMEATVVDVMIQQHHSYTNKDSELKTANVVQLVEDILNQDNSLRKGVIFQKDANNCADVIVYSLYKYLDKDIVRSYCPPQVAECDRGDGEGVSLGTDNNSYKIRPEIKGNVKLFKSCIEKGDLDYLKTLQSEPQLPEPEVLLHDQKGDPTGEANEDWAPVDVQKLKNMFSEDRNPMQESCRRSTKTTNKKSKSSGEVNIKTSSQQQMNESPKECEGHAEEKRHFETVYDDKIQKVDIFDKTSPDFQTATHLGRAEMSPLASSNNDIGSATSSISNSQLGQESHKGNHAEREQTTDVRSKNPTDLDQEQQVQTTLSSGTTSAQKEEDEVNLHGSVQAALKSLEKSNINVTKGDFRAAMIYRNSNKSHQERPQNIECPQNPNTEESRQVTQCKSTPEPPAQELASQNTGDILKKSKKQRGPKPSLPPKPKHLVTKQEDKESSKEGPNMQDLSTTKIKEATQVSQSEAVDSFKKQFEPQVLNSKDELVRQAESQVLDQHMSKQMEKSLQNCKKGKNITSGQLEANPEEEKTKQNAQKADNVSETDESPVDFQKAFQKFGGKTAAAKTAPPKPKRVKMVQKNDKNPQNLQETTQTGGSVFPNVNPQLEDSMVDPSCGTTVSRTNRSEKDMERESKVELRENNAGAETEDERCKRLSFQMGEIMKGNTAAAMEIFENLRKREQLQNILSRVEEMEQETIEVDVQSLRKVFEDVPDWVVDSEKKKPKRNKAKHKEKNRTLSKEKTEDKSSMAHIYGDLARASEDIINLKEQTLARLMDIEEAIKEALYSVSTLKSDSDIAGLSYLLKESLGAVDGSSSIGNINNISIGPSRIKSQEGKESTQINPNMQSKRIEVSCSKQKSSPPSSPAFISIQSAARKDDETGNAPTQPSICPSCQQNPKLEEKFQATKTLTCNSPAQKKKSGKKKQKQAGKSSPDSNREVSVLEVQTGRVSDSGTKTITENYVRTDNFGNQFYSSKMSTVLDAQPETTSTGQSTIPPSTFQSTMSPGIQLPVNQTETSVPK